MTEQAGRVTIQEIRQPELDAMLVRADVADQLERRVAFRRAMKQAVQRAIKRFGAKGVRIQVSGRLGGVGDAPHVSGSARAACPLHTLRADIDYGRPRRARPTASSASRCGSIAATQLGDKPGSARTERPRAAPAADRVRGTRTRQRARTTERVTAARRHRGSDRGAGRRAGRSRHEEA